MWRKKRTRWWDVEWAYEYLYTVVIATMQHYLSCNYTLCLSAGWGRAWPVWEVLPHSSVIVQYWRICGRTDWWISYHYTILVHRNGFPAVLYCRVSDVCYSYEWLDDNCSKSTFGNICWTASGHNIHLLWCELPALSRGSWAKEGEERGDKDNSSEKQSVCFSLSFRLWWGSIWTRFDHGGCMWHVAVLTTQ